MFCKSGFQPVEFVLHLPILLFQILKTFLQSFHLLLGRNTQLLNDLEDPPQPQDNNQRSDFLKNATEEHIDDKCHDYDQCIKAVELALEEAVNNQ